MVVCLVLECLLLDHAKTGEWIRMEFGMEIVYILDYDVKFNLHHFTNLPNNFLVEFSANITNYVIFITLALHSECRLDLVMLLTKTTFLYIPDLVYYHLFLSRLSLLSPSRSPRAGGVVRVPLGLRRRVRRPPAGRAYYATSLHRPDAPHWCWSMGYLSLSFPSKQYPRMPSRSLICQHEAVLTEGRVNHSSLMY